MKYFHFSVFRIPPFSPFSRVRVRSPVLQSQISSSSHHDGWFKKTPSDLRTTIVSNSLYMIPQRDSRFLCKYLHFLFVLGCFLGMCLKIMRYMCLCPDMCLGLKINVLGISKKEGLFNFCVSCFLIVFPDVNIFDLCNNLCNNCALVKALKTLKISIKMAILMFLL